MPIFVDDTEVVNEKVNSFSAFISTKIIIDENQEEQPRIPAVLLGFRLYYFFSKGFQLDRKIFSPKPTASAHADAHAVPWAARTAAITPAIILSLSLLQ